ncbi:MAG: Lipoyltransferase 1, mitochondrial [Marteilia pararefringens]
MSIAPPIHHFHSASRNIHRNLATERFLFNYLFESRIPQPTLLFTYINRPSVVLGRFQNIWHEINPEYIKSKSVDIARRDSGGGCVYHDEGNLNFTFFCRSENMDISKNMAFLLKVLNNNFLKCKVRFIDNRGIFTCSRNDKTKKLGGFASRRGTSICYTHYTFLVNSDMVMLSDCMNSSRVSHLNPIENRATLSVKSSTVNFSELSEDNSLTCEKIQQLAIDNNDCIHAHFFDDIVKERESEIEEIEKEISDDKWLYNESPSVTYVMTNDKGKVIFKENRYLIKTAEKVDAIGDLPSEGILDSSKVEQILKLVQ